MRRSLAKLATLSGLRSLPTPTDFQRLVTLPTLAALPSLAVLVAMFALSLPAHAQERSLVIERFDATLEVAGDGGVEVRERIQVRFTGSWNGIFREIPVEYRTPQGFSYRLRLRDVRVTGEDGTPLEVDSGRRGHYRRLRIRVPGASDAVRTVTVRYRVPNALRFQEEYDELYWNVTGDESEVPILAASATVILPDGVEGRRSASWTGGYGSREDAASVRETEDGFYFETREALSYREGLTIAAAWNPGLVHRPGRLGKAWFWLTANWALFVPLGVLALMWTAWNRAGRDPERLSIAPEYEPPEGLTPAEAGTLIDGRPDMRDITAELVSLAVRGYLVIEESGERGLLSRPDYTLVAVKSSDAWSALGAHERELLRGIFGSVQTPPDRVTMKSLKHEFYEHLPDIKGALFDEMIRRGYYTRRPEHVVAAWLGGAVALLLVLGVGGLMLASRYGMPPLPFAVGAVLSALVVAVFAFFMPARTVPGARAVEKVMGFEEFLRRVESDRFKRMIDSPEKFEAYLPYAMAFGLEDKWAAAFDEIYTEPPDWYRGSWGSRGFRTSYLASSIQEMSSAASSAMTTGPRSSGGSGFSSGGGGFSGGGSSGGGFGGGSVGGW